MPAIGVYGGFGSSKQRIELVAHTIGEHRGESAYGMNFREAAQDLRSMADSMEGKTVYLHSAGFMLAAEALRRFGSRPEHIIAIAPPVPEQVPRLLARGAMIQAGLHMKPLDELEMKMTDENELKRHPIANFRRFGAIACFDALDTAAELRADGHNISVALMKDDGLFDYTTLGVRHSIQTARNAGVPVLGISGGHNQFTHAPLIVLNEVEQAVPHDTSSYETFYEVAVRSLAAVTTQLPRRLQPQVLRQRLTV